jgi:hypothetical protein
VSKWGKNWNLLKEITKKKQKEDERHPKEQTILSLRMYL